MVFEHVIAALVHGSGYERIASPGCSDATIRRRLKEWAAAGLSEQVHTLALRAYDRMIGLDLDELAVDGCLTKAPGGGEAAGRSPVDRGKQGLKRSVVSIEWRDDGYVGLSTTELECPLDQICEIGRYRPARCGVGRVRDSVQ